MSVLIICEKPSVAKTVALALGAAEQKDGYLSGNGLLVSWCIGHLISMADAGSYDERYKKWRYEDIPILPQTWKYAPTPGKEKQLAILKELLHRSDVSEVVNGCDAGREGELIFRFVYEQAGCTKPFSRLWISSMEDSAIREGFAGRRAGTEYDALYQSALCRARADWLVGINATRLFSVLYHKTLNVGRVLSPTLNLLVERDGKITMFHKEKYHIVHIGCDGVDAESERIADAAAADALRAACEASQAVCVSLKKEKKTALPPKLFDLTSLQREANRIYGFTAKQTLDYAQSLYEKRFLTYPRTDSNYLTEDMAQTATDLVAALLPVLPFMQGAELTLEIGRVINSAKVSDHHAIKVYLWFSRPNGTHCLRERDVFLRGTREHNTFRFYHEQTKERVLAYAVVLSGMESGKVKGSIYELDYAAKAELAIQTALRTDNNRLIYEKGSWELPKEYRFEATPDREYGKFVRYEAVPHDPDALRDLLRDESRKRERLKPGNFKEHIGRLSDEKVLAEAQRLSAAFQSLQAPNSPNGTHFVVEVSPWFERIASSKEHERLFALLPYKTLYLSSVKDRHGVFAFISKDERRDLPLRKQRPSVRAQLKEGQSKKTAAPKKAAVKTKDNDLEV